MSAIAPDAVARFRTDLERVAECTVAPDDVLALAVSGGPDSMAMLALAAAAFPGQVIAATVDHGLRASASEEAAMVAAWCGAADIPHTTLALDMPIGPTAIHEQARAKRYDLLARWALEAGAAMLATAHHADDQAETFLMRAVRGSGIAGLSGIRARRALAVRENRAGDQCGPFVAVHDEWLLPLVRPLLDWRRTELRAIAERCVLPFVDDPSNTDARFERSEVRRLLGERPWLNAAKLARAAAHVHEAQVALEAMQDWLWTTRRLPFDDAGSAREVRLDMAGLPRELKRRLARVAIEVVCSINALRARPREIATARLEPLLDAVERGRSATQADVLVSRQGTVWHFREAPPRRSA